MLGGAIAEEFAYGYDVQPADIESFDITDLEATKESILSFSPGIVIHSAAYTDVDGCETNRDAASKVNSQGTRNVALAAKAARAILVHISTDYIFDGQKISPYQEEDLPQPVNLYGLTKLAAEEAVKSILEKFIIVRSCWLYGKGGKNFVDAILNKAKTEKKLKVINDQTGSPTYARDLAGAIKILTEVVLKKGRYGVYNITNSQSCTWFEFAKAILEYKKIQGVEVTPITSQEINRPALRPKNSILDNAKFIALTAHKLRPWPEALREYLAQ